MTRVQGIIGTEYEPQYLIGLNQKGQTVQVAPSIGGNIAIPTATEMSGLRVALDGSGSAISASAVDGATPWIRLYGPNEIRQSPWAGSAELTTPSAVTTYVTAASASSGPVMFRREGAALWFNGATLLANTGNPTFGNWRTTSAGLSAGALANKTIALLVYAHRRGPTTIIKLRIGKNTSNYVTYQWPANTPMLVEGWNVLLCHTAEPIGANAGTGYQMDFQTLGSTLTSWAASAGTFSFTTDTIDYVAFEINNMTSQTHIWWEGLYYGGRDVPTLTMGFDISNTAGLTRAKAVMDAYGLTGYIGAPSGNASSSNPTFLWPAADIDTMQSFHAAGWDVCPHSVSHNSMGTLSDDALLLAEIDACREQIRVMGLERGANLFPTPNSSWSNRLVSVAAKAGISWMRQGTSAPMLQTSGLVGLVNPLIHGSYGMSVTYTLGNAAAIARILAYIDLLILYGCSGHVFTHAILATGNASTSIDLSYDVFEPVCAGIAARVAAGTLQVKRPSDYIRYNAAPNYATALASPNRLPITVGASPYSLTNTGYTPLRIVLRGGTVSVVEYSRDASNYDDTGKTAGDFDLAPGDILRITYSSAPTVTQYSLPL